MRVTDDVSPVTARSLSKPVDLPSQSLDCQVGRVPVRRSIQRMQQKRFIDPPSVADFLADDGIVHGGGLANAITNISGASEVIKGAFVTYSNEQEVRSSDRGHPAVHVPPIFEANKRTRGVLLVTEQLFVVPL